MVTPVLIAGATANAQTTASYTSLSIGGRWDTQTNAALRQTRLTAGDYKNLSIRVTGYTSGTTMAATLQVNGVNTALTVAVAGSATGTFEDLTHTVTVADNAEGRLNWTAGLLAAVSGWSLQFEAASGGPVANYTGRAALSSSTSARLFFSPVGRNGAIDSSEGDEQLVTLRAPGTIDRLRVNITTNGKAVSQQFIARHNATDTTLAVTIPASTTGLFEDLTHSFTVASGDTLSFAYQLSAGVSGNTFVERWEWRFSGSGAQYDLMAADTSGNIPAPLNYLGLGGALQQFASEADAENRIHFATTASNLRVRIGSNTNSPFSIRLRKNGGYGNQTLAIPTGSGLFEDVTNSDSFAPGDRFCIEFPVRTNPTALFWAAITLGAGAIPPIILAPTPGVLTLTGGTPTLAIDEFVFPSPGALILTGGFPVIAANETVDPLPGGLILTGGAPTVFAGITVEPTPGALTLEGGFPAVFTDFAAIATQQAILATGETVADVRTSQVAILATGIVIPPIQVTQQAILITADAVPCVTRWCQVWLFQRTDGVQYGFTSHDEPVPFKGLICQPCSSLNSTASEAASEIGAIGNIELSGIIDSDAINEFDLYAGKFDGCFVEVWETSWGFDGTTPKRLAAGKMGSVSHGREGFKTEVLGVGARIAQQAVTQVVTAACRFVFGDKRCGKDIEALRVAAAVTSAPVQTSNRVFTASALAGDHPDGYFVRGVVTFTTGANAGVRAEVKEYDGPSGSFILWTALPAPLAPGDAFTVTPGCDLSKTACQGWANYVNFGGFPDVPGDDATSETPNAKI